MTIIRFGPRGDVEWLALSDSEMWNPMLEDDEAQRKGGIFIPYGEIDGMSDKELGEHVRWSMSLVKHANAVQFALHILDSPNRLSLEKHEAEIADLKQCAGYYEVVDRVIELANDLELQEQRRREASRVRSELSTKYANIFLALGRRDGFACRHCGQPTSDLQIDHVFPVSRGGTNDLGNLQLLCPDCNRAKSDNVPTDSDGE